MNADEFEDILGGVRRFVRDVVVPLEAEIDDADEYLPRSSRRPQAMGLYGFAIPEEYGGLGLSMYEEVAAGLRARLHDAVVALDVRDQQRHRRTRAARGRRRGAEADVPAEAGSAASGSPPSG